MKQTFKKLLPPIALALGIMAGPFQSSAALLAYYPFDTDALDYSGNGQGLTPMFSSFSTTKQLGVGAFDISTAQANNSSTRRAQRPTGPGNAFAQTYSDFSGCIWARSANWDTGANPERLLLGKHSTAAGAKGWHIREGRDGGRIAFTVVDANGVTGEVQGNLTHSGLGTDPNFHLISFSYHQIDGTTAELAMYWDGVLDNVVTTSLAGLFGNNDYHFQIGNMGVCRTATAGRGFQGWFDDASLWNEKLSAKKIAAIYGLGKLAGVALLDKYPSHAGTQIDEFVAAFDAAGSTTAGDYTWTYDAGTGAAPVGTISGSLGLGNAFVVMDPSGAGMKSGAAVLTVASLSSGNAAAPNDIFLAVGDADPNITVTVPAYLVALGDVDLTITSGSPSVAIPTGAPSGSVNVHFAMGSIGNMANVPVHALGAGTAVFTVSASTPTLLAKNTVTVHTPALVGHWLSGAASLAETSGYQPANRHDGSAVGGNAGAFAFSTDVPLGFTGNSANMTGGDMGITIANTSVEDAGYKNTFDDNIAYNTTIAFWAKGLPDQDWSPWVSKNGEENNPNTANGDSIRNDPWGSIGFQVRKIGGSVHGGFTVRNTPGSDEPEGNVSLQYQPAWHHYAAVRNGVTGKRQLYIDGVPDTGTTISSGDFGAMGLPTLSRLMLDGRNKLPGTLENMTPLKMYDVRIYNGAISAAEIQAIITPTLGTLTPAQVLLNAGDPDTKTVTVTVPNALLATMGTTVTLSSDQNGVAVPVTASVVFTMNGANSQTVLVHAVGAGTAHITASCPDIGVAGSVEVVVAPGGLQSGLIGHWVSGASNLLETSGARPAGTHDGTVVGGSPGNLSFSGDVPPGFTGQSVSLGGDVAVQINNSASGDGGYRNTYDEVMTNNMTIAFWAKGLPGGWNPWIAKRGEDGLGWQIRQHGDGPSGCFTLRGSSSGNEDPRGNISLLGGGWHHYASIWGGVAGTRQLYVDGVLDSGIDLTGDFAPYRFASGYHMVIGARELSGHDGYESTFTGLIYDVRIYDVPISMPQLTNIITPTLGTVSGILLLNVGDGDTATITVTVPASLLVSGSTDVTLTSDQPGVASPVNAVVHFAMGGGNSQSVLIHAGAVGVATITGTCPDVIVAESATVGVKQPAMIGHWVSGAADLVETSGFRPAGTHDGIVVGGTPGNQSFSGDVPAGFSGQSLSLGGDVGVAVANSANVDAAYQNTYDDVIANACTIAFWAKGFPDGTWKPWLSKQGEDNAWQIRRCGDSFHACFSLRGTPGYDEPEGLVDVSAGGVWRHYAAVWDGALGVRKLYVDAVADAGTVIPIGDVGPMGLQTDSHVVFGGKDQGGYGTFSPMNLYDIRIYDSALSQYAVAQLVIPPPVAPALTIKPWTGNQVRISWPVSGSAGYSLKKSSVLPAGWGDAGLTVSQEGSDNVAYAPASGGAQFYRLVK